MPADIDCLIDELLEAAAYSPIGANDVARRRIDNLTSAILASLRDDDEAVRRAASVRFLAETLYSAGPSPLRITTACSSTGNEREDLHRAMLSEISNLCRRAVLLGRGPHRELDEVRMARAVDATRSLIERAAAAKAEALLVGMESRSILVEIRARREHRAARDRIVNGLAAMENPPARRAIPQSRPQAKGAWGPAVAGRAPRRFGSD